VDPSFPDTPRDLKLTHDLGGLHYTVSTWEQVLGRLLFLSALIVAVLVGVLAAATAIGMPGEFAIIIGQLLIGTAGLPLLLSLAILHRRVKVEVSIDQNGMTLQRHRGSQRLTWAACADVRRRGRMLEVQLDGTWRKLPSPNAYTDAAWLEGLIQENIDARQGDAIAPPEEITAALQALSQRGQVPAR
jgi:hypothetical protein